jgi:transposase
VVESTSCLEWFVELAEPLADRVVLAHPRKLRIIAESTRKTDRLDAQVLAEFLALGMIPEAHRAPPRLREHRTLVRHRCFLKRRTTSVKNKLRWLLSRYNADVRGLFTVEGREHLRSVALSPGDRFAAEQLLAELDHYQGQIADMDRRLPSCASTTQTTTSRLCKSTPTYRMTRLLLEKAGECATLPGLSSGHATLNSRRHLES